MGDEQASRAYVDEMLKQDVWQGLTAVQNGSLRYLQKDLFHYKPCANWATAYEQLAE